MIEIVLAILFIFCFYLFLNFYSILKDVIDRHEEILETDIKVLEKQVRPNVDFYVSKIMHLLIF